MFKTVVRLTIYSLQFDKLKVTRRQIYCQDHIDPVHTGWTYLTNISSSRVVVTMHCECLMYVYVYTALQCGRGVTMEKRFFSYYSYFHITP